MKKEEEDKDHHNAEDLNSTRMANSRDKKLTVPFHIPTLTRPQDEFNIFVNNTNQPFEHVWLQRSDDGTRFVHPLEKFSESEFIDIDVGCIEPVKPLPMENTPFKLVEDVKELKQLVVKLRNVNEFAVDLEHNQYRSFQGLTCLMQISTRGEDFVVDTLKLRVHVGPYLREVFKDPSKKKVMHGADRDIVWLQRDFGIYICNLFDTQQASRVLDLERNSLEHLLLYFCGVSVNKVYQNADWRLRPIPDDMLKYAREDTHYLLYIHDLMRRRLFSASVVSKGGNDLLLEVYRRSYDVCMQLYEKELLTNESYMHIYGLPEASFNSQQLSIVAGLCEWRDAVARAEDESTGYILPNKTLLEIARQMPLTVGKLRRLAKSKHPYVEANLDSILGIVRTSIENAASFEYAAQLLMNKHHEMVTEQNTKVASTIPSQQKQMNEQELVNNVNELATKFLSASTHVKYPNLERETVESSRMRGISFQPSGQVGEINKERDGDTLDFSTENMTILRQPSVMYTDRQNSDSGKALSGVTEEVLDKPGHGFTLRNSALELKLDTDPKVTAGPMDVTSAVSSQRERIDDAEGVNKVNGSIHVKTESPKPDLEGIDCSRSSQGSSIQPSGEVEEIKKEHDDHTPNLPNETLTILGQRVTSSDKGNSGLVKHFSGATGEILNNPHHDFGLGNSKLNSKFDTGSKGKVKQIKSLVVLPFQSFICTNEQMKSLAISNNQQNPSPENFIDMLSGTKKFEKVPSLGYLADLIPLFNFPTALHNDYEHRENAKTEGSVLGAEVKTSLTNLSSRFQKCFHFKREKMNLGQTERAQELESVAQSRLRKDQNEMLLTEGEEGFKSLLNLRERHNSSIISRFRKDEVTNDFRQAKQYQSFLRSSSQTFE